MAKSVTYNSFPYGEISPRAFGRNDLDIYKKGLKTAINVISASHGGLVNRYGLRHLLKIGQKPKLFPFSRDASNGYLVVMYADVEGGNQNAVKTVIIDGDNFIDVSVINETHPPWHPDELDELSFAQINDLMIFAHGSYPPWRLLRLANNTWNLQRYAVDEIAMPKKKVGATTIDAWSDSDGWPQICRFMAGRLWFAKTARWPTNIWASSSLNILDFFIDLDNPDLTETSPIGQSLPVANEILDIFYDNSLYVFTAGEEFVSIGGGLISGENPIQFTLQGNYGISEKVNMFLLDGATMFVQKKSNAFRYFYYDIDQQAYKTLSVNFHAEHLHRDTVSIAVENGGNGMQSNMLYAVDADGSCSVFNYDRSQQIQAWTRIDTDGLFVEVASPSNSTHFVIKRDDFYCIERIDVTCTTDSAVFVDYDNSITGLDHLANRECYLIKDGEPLGKFLVSADGEISSELNVTGEVEIGIPILSDIETMPIAPSGDFGNQLLSKKNIKSVLVYAIDTIGLKVKNVVLYERNKGEIISGQISKKSGVRQATYMEEGYHPTVRITQDQPRGFHILAITIEYEA